MESPQMYDTQSHQLDLKKAAAAVMAVNNNNNNNNSHNNNHSVSSNNNNNSSSLNLNNNQTMLLNKGQQQQQQQQQHQQQHNQQQGQLQQQQQQQQQGQLVQLQQVLNNNNNNNHNNNNNNNVILQKHILQQYSQSDLEELASQEISLDLQHLIDDQFREQEALGIFSDLGNPQNNNNNNNNTANNNNNNVNGSMNMAAKVLQQQQQQQQQQHQQVRQNSHQQVPVVSAQSAYQRNALAYMPQPVHTGANYASTNTNTNSSSDDNSSVGSDATNIKEEPVDTAELRRLAAAAAANGNGTAAVAAVAAAQFIAGAGLTPNGGIGYQLPGGNYASNGSGNTFTTLGAQNGVLGSLGGGLHHQPLPHMPGIVSVNGGGGGGNGHISGLKHKQLMQHRKHSNKHVDKGTDEYRRRRERNNIAVRKSREKAKVRSREVEEKVKGLVKEKEALMRRLEEMTGEMQLHKQLYVHLMNHNNPEVNNICRNVLSLVGNNGADHGM